MVGAFDPMAEADKPSMSDDAGMSDAFRSGASGSRATRRTALGLILGTPLLGACSSVQQTLSQFSSPFSSSQPANTPAGPQQQPVSVGSGQVKVGLILPLSAGGNAGAAAQSMKNAAELALSEFLNPNLQLLIKDDAGSAQGAQQSAQQAIDEGAELILGPLFASSVPATAQAARSKGISVIAFSTDSSVAGRGVYLFSFLPAMLPENAYGNVVEAAFKQAVPRRGGRIAAFERYGADRASAARNVAQALGQADALFLADDGDAVVTVADALAAAGANLQNIQLLGTGLWDNPHVFSSSRLQGGLFAAPDPTGFKSFARRYRGKYGTEPVRTATLSYDAVALTAALSRTQGGQRFTADVLQNPSGFAGIDGLFRFRADGTNERGLAVMRVSSGGAAIAAASPKSFGA
jgi:Periplasmic binding protein